MATSTKLILVHPDGFSILNAPPSNHAGIVIYMHWPSQFSLMGVVTKIQEYSQDIESALIASKLPYTAFHIEFMKNDDGTLGATGRIVGVDVPLVIKEMVDNIAAGHAQFVLANYALLFDRKCPITPSSISMLQPKRVLKVYRLREKEEDQICVICQQEYEVNDIIHLLDCDHSFHPPCFKTWLVKKKKDGCPMCRAPISYNDRCVCIRRSMVNLTPLNYTSPLTKIFDSVPNGI